MSQSVILAPLVPLPLVWALCVVAGGLVALALRRGLPGWSLRLLAALVLLMALANPALQTEERRPLGDIVLVLVDESASNRLAGRGAQTEAALARVQAEITALGNTEMRVIRLPDGVGNAGSLAMTALAAALAEAPRGRVAGAIVISDGQVHDIGAAPDLPAPLHLLMTGQPGDWDRRLVVTGAPAFAILGQEVTIRLRIEDRGASPFAPDGTVAIAIALGQGPAASYEVPLNTDLELPLRVPHAGQNVLQLSVAAEPGELTARNNALTLPITGVRDRLRVLLVSGEPHAGERTWRNLLKSDPAVDLVHFTILRPPEKQDGVPVEELALIAFPTRELFVEKIGDFDLIIFDRYSMQGILPMDYIQNVVDYVRGGGTVLVAAGPEFGSAGSLWRTPLAEVLPVTPSARVLSGGFRPALTELGRRHPVTEGLEALAPKGGWGRWFRLVEMQATGGQVVMTGPGDRPLLVLDRVGLGRVAVLASDHMWLWGRGFEGGGPQQELLRRLAHWMLKEPELEEETLAATAGPAEMVVTRRTLRDTAPGPLTLTGPDGATQELAMTEIGAGHHEARLPLPEPGLYRFAQGDLTTLIAVGTAAARETEDTNATAAILQPVLTGTGGGALALAAGLPDLRAVGVGRAAVGRGWIGITPRGATETLGIRVTPLVPALAALILGAGLLVAAWLIEGGRRRARPGRPGPNAP
ncbi:MAG: hypothetical protein ACT4N9_08180 [Paracoccaceae bacterium]